MENFIKKYHLDKSTWTYKGFHGVLHTFFPVGQTGFPMKKFFGDACRITLFLIQNDYVHWYWNDNDLTRLREIFFRRFLKDKNYLCKLQKAWVVGLKRFDLVIREANRAHLPQLSDEELSGLYSKFYKAYVEEFTYFMALGDAISMHADRYIVPEFEKVLGKNFSQVFPQLVSTTHVSFLEQEERDRGKLMEIFRKTGEAPQKLLEAHAAKYFYITNNYAKAIYLTGNDFLKMMSDDLKDKIAKKVERDGKEKIKKRAELIKKYRLSQWHKSLLYVLDEFFGIQDTRKKYVLISNYYQFRFLQELERRSGISLDLLKYSIYPEFKEILKRRVNKKIFEERKRGCACIQTPGSYEIITGKQVRNLLNYFIEIQKGAGELRGIVASRGKKKGRVKIILKVHDVVNMEDGDILVASMTRPEMVPAMKRAGAIVTDEGGLTCHAAIVSRELKIPCIIGTKIATKVLKDGDLVEVDAEKGIIKKVK
jgi:phosphohistidine swiveling domain-containing protein